MKAFILFAALIGTLSLHASATVNDPVSKKAETTFYQIFKEASNVRWSSSSNAYHAFFTVDGIKSRATIDANGKLIQTIRYYDENKLPANVLYAVQKEYPKQKVIGVTEVSNRNGVNYRIVLKDDKSYTHINANSVGNTEVFAKYKRGDK